MSPPPLPSMTRQPEGALVLREDEEVTACTRVDLDVDALYRRHARDVGRWASRLCGPDIDVEDIVHEVFLVAHKRRHTFRGTSKPSTWLYGITLRVVSDRRRARTWRRWFGLSASDRREGEPGVDAAAGEPSALDRLEGEQARRQVYDILDGLKEEHRTVLVLFELEGMPGQEIAAVTGTTVANVWVRLFRARKEFTKRFLAREAAEGRGEIR